LARNDLLTAVAALAVVGVGGVAAYAYLNKQNGPGGTYAVSVLVLSPLGPFPGALVELGGQVSTTNQSGTASFAGIQGGTYLLSVNATGYSLAQQSVVVGAFSTSFTVNLSTQGGCTPQACSCGLIWDSVLCKCSSLIPYAVLLPPPPMLANLAWFVWPPCFIYGSCATILNCVRGADVKCYEQGIPTSCFEGGYIPPNLGTLSWKVPVKGTVVDSHGYPICGVKVVPRLSTNDLKWSDGSLGFKLSVPNVVTTGENGEFKCDVQVTMYLINVGNCLKHGAEGTQPLNFSLDFTVQNTVIMGFEIVNVSALVCYGGAYPGSC
jgi:hypothetical protein